MLLGHEIKKFKRKEEKKLLLRFILSEIQKKVTIKNKGKCYIILSKMN